MIEEKLYETILEYNRDHSLSALWNALEYQQLSPDGIPEKFNNFNKRKELFFWILERLLKERKLELAKNGVLSTVTVEEQIKTFKEAFPKTDEQIAISVWLHTGFAVWISDEPGLEGDHTTSTEDGKFYYWK